MAKKIEEEHGKIVARAKDIGKSKLLSSYIMASYYIAMNRSTGKSAQENFEIFRDGLCASKLFHKVMGDVDSYLDPKKMPGRLKWSEDSHKRLYENDWVVDILPVTIVIFGQKCWIVTHTRHTRKQAISLIKK